MIRTVLLLAVTAMAPLALAQPDVSARTDHVVHTGGGGCCACCGSGGCADGMCAHEGAGHEGREHEGMHGQGMHEGMHGQGMEHAPGDVQGAGMGCCAGMHGEGEAGGEGMSCRAGMHGDQGMMPGDHEMMHGMMHEEDGTMHMMPGYGSTETGEHGAVRGAVIALFDAMRAGNGDGVRNAFHPGAVLQSVGAGRDGAMRVETEAIEGFATMVGAPHPDAYDERLGAIEVRLDGPLATAWSTYRFYIGDTFSHCGVDAFQLANTGDGWKIIAVSDTRRAVCEGMDGE